MIKMPVKEKIKKLAESINKIQSCYPFSYNERRNHKYDITRLKNLLRNYRDSIITNILNTIKHLDPVCVIEKVDQSLNLIIDNLK